MSTSPSWFDQEKFSRLVKKVGPKAAPAGSPPVAASRAVPLRPPEKETRRLQRSLGSAVRPPSVDESPVSPSPIRSRTSPLESLDGPIRATPQETAGNEGDTMSSLFPPPMPLPEPRSVSPLSRRTSPLPNLKPIFEYERPDESPAASTEESEEEASASAEKEPDQPEIAEEQEQPEFPGLEPASGDAPPGWQAFQPLGEEALRPESPAPGGSGHHLDELLKQRDELAERVDELSRAAEERDEARHESELLRAQLQQADEIIQATGVPGANLEEFTRTVEERDSARRDYANLREQFETLKHDPSRSAGGAGSEAKTGSAADRDEEMVALKAHAGGLEKMVETLKQEMDAMHAQISQSRDETSVAQRGLALSQRALQETRDALREASEGFSLTKSNVENLKNECASLVQQNLALQSQNDQIARELGSTRARLSGPS